MDKVKELLDEVKKIAIDAGDGIMSIYTNEELFNVEIKSDDSPLTAADKLSNDIICKGLKEMDTQFPLISEENKEIEYEERSHFETYWLIDPLDGTKEFIKRNGEFTVNIALIQNGRTIMGVVYAPVLEEMYWASKDGGAFMEKKGMVTQIASNRISLSDSNLRIVCSRSHLNEETQAFINQFDNPQKVAKGSSLKFLIIARGDADIYPRLGPTMEWDTAAAQIILEEAGGSVINEVDKQSLNYNKESLRNPNFIAYAHLN